MKKIFNLLILLFVLIVLSPRVQAEDEKPKEEIVNQIVCELQLPKKKIFNRKEAITFHCRCRSLTTDYFFMPQHMTANLKLFDPRIIIQDEQGKTYQFVHFYFIKQNDSFDFSSFRNTEAIYSLRFPDNYRLFRLVDSEEWNNTKEHQVDKRTKIFDKGFTSIPPGKYTAWVDNRAKWQTVMIGNMSMVLSNYKNYGEEDITEVKWEISQPSEKVYFEVKK